MFADAEEEGMSVDILGQAAVQGDAVWPPSQAATESGSSAPETDVTPRPSGKRLAPLPAGFRKAADARNHVTFAREAEGGGSIRDGQNEIGSVEPEDFPAIAPVAQPTAVGVWGSLPASVIAPPLDCIVSLAPAPALPRSSRAGAAAGLTCEDAARANPDAAVNPTQHLSGGNLHSSVPPALPAAVPATVALVATVAITTEVEEQQVDTGTPLKTGVDTPLTLAEQEVQSITLDRADPFAPRGDAMSDVLVVDTAGFIKNAPLQQLARRIITVREVSTYVITSAYSNRRICPRILCGAPSQAHTEPCPGPCSVHDVPPCLVPFLPSSLLCCHLCPHLPCRIVVRSSLRSATGRHVSVWPCSRTS